VHHGEGRKSPFSSTMSTAYPSANLGTRRDARLASVDS